MSSTLESNKKFLLANLEILENNIKLISDKLFKDTVDDLITDIHTVRCNLDKVRTDCAFTKVFFDFFIVMQEFHSYVNGNCLSELVGPRYSGYYTLYEGVISMRKDISADNVHVLIKNTRIFMRRIKYLDGYLRRNFILARVSEMTGSDNGLDRYSRRLGRILNSLIKMLNSGKESVKKITSMSDKLHEIGLLIDDLEEEIKRLPDFREKLRPAEQLIEEKF